ncbi:primosomal protein N' [bacterium]|nr:primosomal protein N' [bacterium]
MTSTTSLFASVALPVPVNTYFTYSIPVDIQPSAEVGRRALVPFGRRLLTGFIVGLSDNPGDVPLDTIKPLEDILDTEPVFNSTMLELAKWVADYYVSTTGEVLKVAMPHGTMIRSQVKVSRTIQPDESGIVLTSRQKTVLERLDDYRTVTLKHLERTLKFKVSGILRSLENKGLVRLEREITTPSLRIKTERYVRPVPDTPVNLPRQAKKQLLCLEELLKHPAGVPLQEILERHGFSRGVVNSLVDAGLALYEEVEITRESGILSQEFIEADHPLTVAQNEAVAAIMNEAVASRPRPVLLKGITGSGKTRVYIELVREALRRGKGAIILVPEISLTPQTTRFFSSVFPGRVAVLHSAMSPGERYDSWRLIHDGARDVVIGPRSAVFAPVPDPGIIIVDEEHDSSYKQTDTSPRYHARDVAVVRGTMLGIPVVLGSATPSLETWHNAVTGKYALSSLKERVDARPLPSVILVDMKEEWASGNHSSLSGRLREEIKNRIGRGEKSIILINHRGFATVIRCKSCGYVLSCPRCAIGLTYHSSKRLAVCHLCGHSRIILEHCPECGSSDLQYRGMGTQRIEKELETITGKDSIVRMDSDTTQSHDAHFRLLDEFRNGSASILIGTQMVAKGHDIPDVTLVGVISADLSLHIPDFRAGERTFQLVTQVAGRAGRGSIPGTVVIQTFQPDNYAISAASRQDFESFADHEMNEREELGFPPFSRLSLLELSSDDRNSLDKPAEDIVQYLTANSPGGTEIMGPVDAPIARIRGRYRKFILIKSGKLSYLRPFLRNIADKMHGTAVTVDIDVDPVEIV